MTELAPLEAAVLPSGIRSRFVPGINGLRMHVLEAGFEDRRRPLVLLLHGFPELAYSWRKVMLPLAAAGFLVVAPDQRGYGRTTGWNADYDGDLGSFRILNAVRDALGLVSAAYLPSIAPTGAYRWPADFPALFIWLAVAGTALTSSGTGGGLGAGVTPRSSTSKTRSPVGAPPMLGRSP